MTKEELKKLSDEHVKFAQDIGPRLDEFNNLLQRVKKNPDLVKLQDLARSLVSEVQHSKFSGDVLKYLEDKNITANFIEAIPPLLQWDISAFTTIGEPGKASLGWPSWKSPINIPLLGADREANKVKLIERGIILNDFPDC